MSLPPGLPNVNPNVTQCLQDEALGPLDRFLCVQRSLGENISSCLTGFPPTPLTNTADCAAGFYCPHINASQEWTWPQYCPPTIECQFARLEGQWCAPQGTFEPMVCEGGRYCPNATASLLCPEGTFCVRGSTVPRACGPLSLCPPGTQTPTFYGGILVAALIDAALAIAFVYLRCVREPAQRKANSSARRRELVRAADLLMPGAAVASLSVATVAAATAKAAAAEGADAAFGAKFGGERSTVAGAAAVVAQNPLRSALRGAGGAGAGPADLAEARRAAFEDDVDMGGAGVGDGAGDGTAGWGASLRDTVGGWLVRLPAGVSRDRRGRVRTRSMRRASGTGPLYANLVSEADALDSAGFSDGGADTGAGVGAGMGAGVGAGAGADEVAGVGVSSRANRVSRMATEAAAVHGGGGALSPPGLPRGRSAFSGVEQGGGKQQQSFSARSSPSVPTINPLDRLVASSATLVLEDGFRRCNASLRLGIDFRGLRLTLPPPLKKTILSDVTGRISPGRVTAVMGPSGAGKTTFLSVLMGKVARTAGTLHVNGLQDEMTAFKRVTGFVPQDDTMLHELTVRENIAHSARVRLPRHGGWDAAAVARLVDAVIEVLGLHSCADTTTDRISGGQRKRTNIGMELAMAPAAIFLDEPTSGLDATAALEVCNTLRAIANLGLTVVAVVHQPRAEIFRSFDDLLLLAPGGKTVYMGPQEGVVRYFAGAGFAFGRGGNPADDLLDFIAGRDDLLVAPADLVAAQAANEAADLAERLAAAAELAASRRSTRAGSAISLFESLVTGGDSGSGSNGGGGGGGETARPSLPHVKSAAAALAAAAAAAAAVTAAEANAARAEAPDARPPTAATSSNKEVPGVGPGAGAGAGAGAAQAGAGADAAEVAASLAQLPLSPSSTALKEAAVEAMSGAAKSVRLHGSEVAAYLAARWRLEIQRGGPAAAAFAGVSGSMAAAAAAAAGRLALLRACGATVLDVVGQQEEAMHRLHVLEAVAELQRRVSPERGDQLLLRGATRDGALEEHSVHAVYRLLDDFVKGHVLLDERLAI